MSAAEASFTQASPNGSNGPGDKNFSRTPTSWDTDDDVLLMHLKDKQKLGWKEIASHFTNRTPNACQFRWRRLKSGNLKNPPKSAVPATGSGSGNSLPNVATPNSTPSSGANLGDHDTKPPGAGGFPSAYSPISNAAFTGYDSSVSNALAGLNALSNTPSHRHSVEPDNSDHSDKSDKSDKSDYDEDDDDDRDREPYRGAPHGHGPHHDAARPSLGKTSHSHPGSRHGSPHGPSHPRHDGHDDPPDPHDPHHHRRHSTPRTSIYNDAGHLSHLHQNSIIQISKDDRTSFSFTRASVLSLPSKSMNIPHHQLNNNALAHLPILFGNNSISGPSRNSSISGAAGLLPSNISLRNGSIGSIVGMGVGSSTAAGSASGASGAAASGTPHGGYFSRSGSVVIPHSSDKKDEDLPLPKPEVKKNDPLKNSKRKIRHPVRVPSSNAQPMFKIPWSIEEDELLINRRNRELSFAELSILLPQRTEGEIWSRIDYLEKLRNGHRSSTSRDHRKRRQSSIGLEVPDFYDEVDDVIGDIDSDDDDVLVEVDDSVHTSKKGRKRRASSAVNPLSVDKR